MKEIEEMKETVSKYIHNKTKKKKHKNLFFFFYFFARKHPEIDQKKNIKNGSTPSTNSSDSPLFFFFFFKINDPKVPKVKITKGNGVNSILLLLLLQDYFYLSLFWPNKRALILQ